MLILAQIKSIKVLLLCCGSGDTKYPQKQGKFTTFRLVWLFCVYYHASNIQKLSGRCICDIYKANNGGRFELMRQTYARHHNLLKVRTIQSEMSSRSMILRSPTSTLAKSVILFLNQRYTRLNPFHEEFGILDAALNILLSKQYISILKNHCIANNATDTQL